MAIIRSGVLGNTRGKVGGVVGGQYKDVNYIREYVKPANPNTAAQIVQRDKMRDCVAYAKPLVGQVFNALTDKFQKHMSGFNFFIKRHIAEFDGTPDYGAIKITEGKLSPIKTLAMTYNTADGETILTWVENLGNNGAGDDKVTWAIYDQLNGIWYFSDAAVDRDTETDTQTLPTGLIATNLCCYGMVAQYAGTIVDIIADSLYDLGVAP